MKYLIIGAGGTGGMLAGHMAKSGLDVSVIARGEHLKAIRENGLSLNYENGGESFSVRVNAYDAQSYNDTPDVVFVCVKGYSIDSVVPLLRRVAANAIVIPLLNIYGTGERLQALLPDALVTDGCIYVNANITSPGVIAVHASILRVVYGVRSPDEMIPALVEIASDLQHAGVRAILSDNIRRDAFQKFAYVSPMAASGAYFDSLGMNADAAVFQQPGEVRDMFIALTREVCALAKASGIVFKTDIEATNIKILDALAPNASTSMQRDLRLGRESEADGLVFEVVRMGEALGVDVPAYEKVARAIAR